MKSPIVVKSYGHRINVLPNGIFKLSWQFSAQAWSSDKFYIRTMTRNTDKAGAMRFAKKWKIQLPKTRRLDADNIT